MIMSNQEGNLRHMVLSCCTCLIGLTMCIQGETKFTIHCNCNQKGQNKTWENLDTLAYLHICRLMSSSPNAYWSGREGAKELICIQ